MAGRSGRGIRLRRVRLTSMVAGHVRVPNPPPPPLAIDAASPERMVRDKFPDLVTWMDVCLDIIRYSTYKEHARFIGDKGCLNLDLIFRAIHEAESSDPTQAAL